jgi:lipoyl(octanoyl) transferase
MAAEHPPLYTAGTAHSQAICCKPDISVYASGRGGQYTYHGPASAWPM